MAVSTTRNSDGGPFTLYHDPTPRDAAITNQVLDALPQDNFRFRGFPGSNFEKERDPVRGDEGLKSFDPYVSPREKHGLPRLFDTDRPRIYKDHKGIQYGSDEITFAPPGPRPVRDPFHEKTSEEIVKFRNQQQQVEAELKQYKEEKLAKQRNLEEEKRMDMEQLRGYNPFGKPGGGAPMPAGMTKKQKFDDTSSEQQYTPRRDPKMAEESYNYQDNFGLPGGGAPIRTTSGRVVTELKGDPDTRFQEGEVGLKMVDQNVRYNNHPAVKKQYSKDLDLQRRLKELEDTRSKISEKKMELESLKYDPYGRPGAGAPNTARSETDNVPAAPGSPESRYDPWGKGSGNPVYDNFGKVQRHKQAHVAGVVTTVDSPRGLGASLDVGDTMGGGAPMKTESGRLMARHPITLRKDERGNVRLKDSEEPAMIDPDNNYVPWNKPGGGAPIYNERGVVQATRRSHNAEQQRAHQPFTLRLGGSGDQQQKALAKQQYMHQLQEGMEYQKKRKEKEQVDLRAPAPIDFAEKMRQGVVGNPKRDPITGVLADQHLPSTDVTVEKTDQRHYKGVESNLYHNALEQAAEQRHRTKTIEQLREKQEEQKHQSTFGQLWGRPGGGAPNAQGTKKINLDNVSNEPKEPPQLYLKQNAPLNPYTYQRSTIPSTHTNGYENMRPAKVQGHQKDYHLNTPYAASLTNEW